MLTRCILPLLLIIFCIKTISVDAQTFKNEADTSQLKNLRQYPRKNSLPVRKPVLIIEPVVIPDSSLKLKVNYWRNWASFGINLNQASFSDNWSAGGINSLALGSLINIKTDYTKGDKNFVSEAILQYGKLKNKGQLERKINDRVFWDNKVAMKLSKSWYFFGSINFESQFDRGFSFSKNNLGNETRTLISHFMSPGYLTESFGFEYKPTKSFFLRIGTGTARQTFVLDTSLYHSNSKNYGVKIGQKFRNELAFQIVSSFDKEIAKNLNLKSRYAMFANYERLSHIDHRLDLTLAAKVNRLINVSIAGVAIYDDDSDEKVQASQGLSLGLVYKFPK